MDNADELASETDADTLDSANDYNKERTRFQKGNEQGVRFAPKPQEPDEDQLEIEEENPDDQL